MKKIIVTIFTVLALAIMLAFSITAYADSPIEIGTIELIQNSYTYTGSKIEPEFNVYDTNGQLVDANENNYSYTVSNSTNVGTATLTVTGNNLYSGTLSTTYKITARPISQASLDSLVVYLDNAPAPTLKFNGSSLKNDVDYTYTVSSPAKAGENTVYTIKGKGNFNGTKTVTRATKPTKVQSISVKSRTNTSIEIKWASQSNIGVANYKVYKCNSDGSNKKLVATTTESKATISGYSAGNYAYIVVRSYVNVDGTNYYSDYSKVFKTTTKPAKVVVSNVSKSTDKSKLKVSWGKQGSTGYQIQYSTDKSFGSGVKTVEVTGSSTVSKSISIPKNSKTYYVRIRAFRRFNYNGTKYVINGSWSNVVSTQYNKVYASFYTENLHPENKNRTTNLKLACKAINGTVIKPGETFSFNKVVGRRTPEKGYKEATIFTGSSGTAQSTGGGICQVASTIFNAALRGNMGIVERYQHSQRVAYCSNGYDAAIYWGSEDFKFKNTTGYPIKIEMTYTNNRVYCKLKVSYDVAPPKVTFKRTVTGSGKAQTFTVKRYVNGKCNYTAKSKY